METTDKRDNSFRELYFSDKFLDFYHMLPDKVKTKFEHINYANTSKNVSLITPLNTPMKAKVTFSNNYYKNSIYPL